MIRVGLKFIVSEPIKKQILHFLILIPLISSCQNYFQNQYSDDCFSSVDSFEITIQRNEIEISFDFKYVLSEKTILIMSNKVSGNRLDSVIFSAPVPKCDKLKHLSCLNTESLKEYYENPCIEDGVLLFVIIKKNSMIRNIYLSNYYQNDIGIAIELINNLIPESYKIPYNKEKMIKAQNECDGQMKITDGLQFK